MHNIKKKMFATVIGLLLMGVAVSIPLSTSHSTSTVNEATYEPSPYDR